MVMQKLIAVNAEDAVYVSVHVLPPVSQWYGIVDFKIIKSYIIYCDIIILHLNLFIEPESC